MAGAPGQADCGNEPSQPKKRVPPTRHELSVTTKVLGQGSPEPDGEVAGSVFQKEPGV